MRIAFVASSIPRRCGIATFTADLAAAVKSADPSVRIFAAAINEPGAARAYGPEVRWRIQQEEASTYRDAAVAISASSVDIVNLQHEFGLYGMWHDGTYDDHLRVFLENCTKPVVTTLHTVAPKPEPWALETVRFASEHSEQIVVMGSTAARLLRDVYGVSRPPVVIEHGMPAIEPRGRHRLKRQLGVEDRPIVSTFGLVDPRKGLEYVIEAMPEIVARHPRALYLVVGQTHPELQKREGEAYRNSLIASSARLGRTSSDRTIPLRDSARAAFCSSAAGTRAARSRSRKSTIPSRARSRSRRLRSSRARTTPPSFSTTGACSSWAAAAATRPRSTRPSFSIPGRAPSPPGLP